MVTSKRKSFIQIRLGNAMNIQSLAINMHSPLQCHSTKACVLYCMQYNNYVVVWCYDLYTYYVDDSTLFEICHRNSESVLQHSVDIAARWTLHNDMKINSDKSK